MDSPSPADPLAESVTPDDRAYDSALAALARGEEIDVEALCRDAGGSEGLRERLEALRHVARAAPRDSKPPFERLGEFRLIRALGEGSMGVVWLASQDSLKRLVALKMIRAERIGSRDAESRFEREAFALARLRHPNVVPVFAAGESHGVRYLAMELIDGESLADRLASRLARGELPDVPGTLRVLLDVARALEAAHDAGIVHRDVKPSNVLIGRDGRGRLTDFGLALEIGAPAMSQSAGFLGTPFYAAPEQVAARRNAIGPRSDVYSLGATLYEATTGMVPFPADSAEQAMQAILHAELVPPRRRNHALSRDLEAVIEKAMERDPARRYESAAALAADFEALLALRPTAARSLSGPRRVARKMRAHPLAATAIGACLLIAAAIPLGVIWRDRAEAVEALRSAQSRLGQLKDARERASDLEQQFGALRRDRMRRPLSDDEEVRVRRAEAERRALEHRRDEAFHAGLAALSRAESLGAGSDGVSRLRARLYLELWRERIAAGDRAGAAALVPRVAENDPRDEHRAELEGLATLSIVPTPPEAEVFVFRYVEHSEVDPDGEDRLVPVPIGGDSAIPPGAHVLRVTKGAGELRAGDLVLEVAGRPIRGSLFAAADAPPIARLDRLVAIDGEPVRDLWDLWVLSAGRIDADGEPLTSYRYEFEREAAADGGTGSPPLRFEVESGHQDGPPVEIVDARGLGEKGGVSAQVFRDGAIETIELSPGLALRWTATPQPLDGAARQTGAARLPAGSYLAVLRADGHELQRLPFVLDRGGALELRPRLLESVRVPVGFVHVPAGAVALGGDPGAASGREMTQVDLEGFFIQEREVTFREWLDFVSDPETRLEIDTAQELIRMPRRPDNANVGGYLTRAPDGRIMLPLEWADWPVLGVSAEDCEAYARWKTKRERAKGLAITYRLPTADEWEKAARGADLRRYPFGDRYGQRFSKSALSRSVRADTPFDISPEPVMSFPIDESPFGVFDLAGSQREWTATDFSSTRLETMRDLRGGAWNDNTLDAGPAAARFAAQTTAAEAGYGLRLAADESEP